MNHDHERRRKSAADEHAPHHARHEAENDSSTHHGGMGMRGVTMPMAEQEVRQHQQEGHEQEGDEHGAHHDMSREDRLEMLRMHHQQTLWIYWTVVLLGLWTMLAPWTLGYATGTVEPSGGRDVWLSLPARIGAMTWSDVVSGLLLVVFGWRSLTPNRPVSLWICCFVGIWLSFAPILFWAPISAAYLNGTLIGMLVIALTVLIPGMPNMIMYMKMGAEKPAGWSYNPSSWAQRSILIALAFVGWLVSRHLTAYQLGYIDDVWEPFFGAGSIQVLDSEMSHMWPVSDAALGAFAFTIEFLMGWMGSKKRWRTMPWMVTLFGIVVIPLGLVHIALVISQPVVVGAWCTLCLLAAAIMLPMIALTVDEVIAMGQHMVQARRSGHALWEIFWKGGPAEEAEQDERTPEFIKFPQEPAHVARASLWGMSFPWTLVASTVIGVGLMFMPDILGVEGRASDVMHLGGALIIVTSVIAMGEPVRAARYLNVPLGLLVAVLPWILGGAGPAEALIAATSGVLLAVLAVPRGPKTEQYGLWDRYVR